MVAQLVGLRLALLSNTLTGSPRRALAIVVGLLLAVGATVLACALLIGLRDASTVTAETAVVSGGSVLVLAFVLVPLLLQRGDPLDPRRFGLLGIEPNTLARAIALSSFVSLPVIAAALVSLASVITWSSGVGLTLLGLLGAVLTVATCVLGGRFSASIAAYYLTTRRSKEIAAVIGVLLVVLLAPALVLAVGLNGGVSDATWLQNLAQVLGLTPFGAPWAITASAANGDGAGAFLSFAISVASVAVLWFGWRAFVGYVLTTTRPESVAAEASGLGWFGRLPSTPAGAVAARSLTYWARDPRYFVPLIIIPVVPIVWAIPVVLVSFPLTSYALVPLPVMCMFLGFAIHNDLALDSSAVWLHIVSGRRGLADRVGRLAPVLMIGLPLIGIGSVVTVFLANNSAALPSVLGISTCLLLTSVGLGSFLSARFPYSATRPGDSPFVQPQTTGSTSVFVQLAIWVGTLALAAPSILNATLAELEGNPGLHWAALWWGVGVGVVVLVLGVAGGASIFNRRGPEILAVAAR